MKVLVAGFLLLVLILPVWTDVRAQDAASCLACHGERSFSMQKKGKSVPLFVDGSTFKSSAHAALECVACHTGFNPEAIPHKKRITPVDCASCHDGENLARYRSSIHGAAGKDGKSLIACADCHSTHAIRRIPEMGSIPRKEFGVTMCAKCHGEVRNKYMASNHGNALESGARGAPTCIDCHGEHGVQSAANDSSATSHKRVAAMCLSCHLDNPDVRAKVGLSAGFVSDYEMSVHGQAVLHGNSMAATCTDCHSSHEMRKGSDPASWVSRKNIASTCGRCHGDLEERYSTSVHGRAVAAGNPAAATCTDCHGEHNILSPKDERSPVAARNISAQVCSPCHASVRLNEKYGLAAGRFESFSDSYHGLAGKAGNVEVANCASCHGVHDIKPSSDSTSRINAKNLVSTCGTCHPGANANFARGSVHVLATAGQDKILYIVATTYIVLIITTIGGMFLHNLLDFIARSKRRLMIRRGLISHIPADHRLYLRMTLDERIQHGLLLISFTALVVTGFALRFPDAWWVVPIRNISPVMFDLRGIAHRLAGVVLVAGSLYHVYYVMSVPRGKQLLRDMIPDRADLIEAVGILKHNLGLSVDRPKCGRFSYVEKAEYWSLIWGTFVMAATGFILWFDNTFIGLLTKLGWDVARTIHYYEAWLATLAIIVWHFYFVMFNPDTYPLNLAFWKGTLSEEEMLEEHPRELEALKLKQAQREQKQ